VPRRLRIVAIVAALLCAGSGRADPTGGPDAAPRLELSVGALDVFDGPRPLGIGAAYRWRPLGRWSLAPGAGLLAGSDGSRYVYADLSRSFALGAGWYTVIVFGAGYFHDGSTVQLGHELEFRSGLEVGRRLDARWRLGLAFDHLSNAGLADHNPGTDIVALRLSAALGAVAQPAVAPSSGTPAAPAAASWRSSSRRISSPASAR
jgi:hypothetical protein